ncbi:unnamed protein product [Nyctereutes procyonoides]|uniref:(raccoon dog) hypothetical protein n=1 Tax=Nyctereutes procyonoides TaxID=34880 RepID=A0A811ZUH9_NYCPR|nr:unnamed protein product [Nyctereutes procyonoides]
MLYHTVLPTAVCSFIVAVNAPFLSFSPLKIREHTGLGCVRQSIPRVVSRGECGSDGSPHWGRWACVRESQSLWLNSLPCHRQSSHHCSVEVFGFVEGFYGFLKVLPGSGLDRHYGLSLLLVHFLIWFHSDLGWGRGGGVTTCLSGLMPRQSPGCNGPSTPELLLDPQGFGTYRDLQGIFSFVSRDI